MTNGGDRVERIRSILEDSAKQHAEIMARVDKRLDYMAARQQYHDEAFERSKATMRRIEDAQRRTGERIRTLVRLEGLEGGEIGV